MLCKGRGFCGAMGNDASRETVDVRRASLVRAQDGARADGRTVYTVIKVKGGYFE